MKKHTAEENQEKKVTLLQKVSYLFDRKQKRQIAGLALLILIGGRSGTESADSYAR